MILALASVIPPVRAVHRQNSAGASCNPLTQDFLPASDGMLSAERVFNFIYLYIHRAR
jgi:hypothetical protein